MLRRVSIEGFTSFQGVRWRLLDPTTELTLVVQGRAQPGALKLYARWFERRFSASTGLSQGTFPQGWLVNPEADPLAVHLAAAITALQRLAMQPVRRAQVLASEPGRLRLALPGYSDAVLEYAIQLAIQLLLETNASDPAQGERLLALNDRIDEFLKRAVGISGSSAEQLRFALAAHHLGLPLVASRGGCLESGHGCGRRFTSNSFLSPAPAAAITRDKIATQDLLQQAGLPVPATVSVNTEAELAAAAQRLGWPLVVKPSDQSLTRGVTTGVADRIALEAAFRVARNISGAPILVQQQVAGDEFRLTAIGSAFQVARQINPAVVEGDGRSSVEQLVARCNADPRRGDHGTAICARIRVDADAEALLAEQHLSLAAIPAAGRRIRLSRDTGRLNGGLTTDAMGLLHPSYLALLERVRRVLQLEIIGLDLITPEPARPWWQVKAVVLEVNARPGLVQHEHANPTLRIYEEALRHGLRDGQQPLLLAAGGGDGLAAVWPALETALAAVLPEGTALGVLRDGACHLGGEPLPLAAEATAQVGQALLADSRCGAALLAWQTEALAAYGRPCERLDLAVLADGLEPLVLQEVLDADPLTVLWIGPGQERWAAALADWQGRDSAHRLVQLDSPAELATCLPELLSISTHPVGVDRAVRVSAP